MRAFVAACALAALYSSYQADAGLGDIVADTDTDARLALLNEKFSMVGYPVDLDEVQESASRPRGRMRSVSAVVPEDTQVPPVVGSDLAVRTRIQTCQGVAVTITSFGGGEWDQDIEAFCDEASIADDTSEQSDTP